MQILLLKLKNSTDLNSTFHFPQDERVHAWILIIKISSPSLAMIWGLFQWSITYKWKSYLICGIALVCVRECLHPIVSPDGMKSRHILCDWVECISFIFRLVWWRSFCLLSVLYYVFSCAYMYQNLYCIYHHHHICIYTHTHTHRYCN